MEPQLPLLRSDRVSWDWLSRFPVWGRFPVDDSGMWRRGVYLDPFVVDCEALKIKAWFFSAEGMGFDGVLSVERLFDETYLLEIWSNQRWFGFNWHLPDLAEQARQELRAALNKPA